MKRIVKGRSAPRALATVVGAMALAAASVGYGQTSESTRLLQVLSVKEFMQLTDDMQAVFVGGVLDGMAFTSYGMSWPGYSKWVDCVRAKPLGETSHEVVAFLKDTPSFQEGVASAVAQALGKRCRKS